MNFNVAPPKQNAVEILPKYSAKELTEGGDQAHIILDEQLYKLRITRSGKLILTK
ncbi:MAG: hemin uptake protein HemP [Planktomarina sp.]|nr:hemin uptake protein HemP [Planktomarina sp.]|tara:strand:+ start:453 stop:617 length:165 start_codon:yes stop_codon:yes gene_type:complete